jgi:hypothetical protein
MIVALLKGKTAVIQPRPSTSWLRCATPNSGPDPANPDIPHITEPVIVKYVTDLAQLGLL